MCMSAQELKKGKSGTHTPGLPIFYFFARKDKNKNVSACGKSQLTPTPLLHLLCCRSPRERNKTKIKFSLVQEKMLENFFLAFEILLGK